MIEIEFLSMKIYREYRTEIDMHPITLNITISLTYLVLAHFLEVINLPTFATVVCHRAA